MTGRKRRSGHGVTIRTVSDMAGVSAMTVSNVVNGTGKVGEATRRRVEAAIRETGYVPNAAARGLASPGSSRLGILYARPTSAFVSAALVGSVVATSRQGVQLLARDCGEAGYDELAAAMRSLVESGAAALLLLPPFAEMSSGSPIMTDIDVPVAAISTGDGLPDIVTVRIDERAAAAAATELLLDRGHRRIGFITGPPSHSGSRSRLAGFADAMARRGLAVADELNVGGDYTFASGILATGLLLGLADRPTAIFASNDEMAAGVAWAAHQRGIVIPGELAIMGFDDSPLAERVFPPLTAVHQPVAAMAERAAELLIDAMRRSDGVALIRDNILPFSIVERGST